MAPPSPAATKRVPVQVTALKRNWLGKLGLRAAPRLAVRAGQGHPETRVLVADDKAHRDQERAAARHRVEVRGPEHEPASLQFVTQGAHVPVEPVGADRQCADPAHGHEAPPVPGHSEQRRDAVRRAVGPGRAVGARQDHPVEKLPAPGADRHVERTVPRHAGQPDGGTHRPGSPVHAILARRDHAVGADGDEPLVSRGDAEKVRSHPRLDLDPRLPIARPDHRAGPADGDDRPTRVTCHG